MSCYAYSFDSINRAVTAIYSDLDNLEYLDPLNMADPNFAERYKRFRSCTTEDFVIEVYELTGIRCSLRAGFLRARYRG